MNYSTPEQLRFPPVAGLTVRGDFEGGALSSDFGPLLLRGVDRQIGLTECLAAAFQDQRHPSYLTHPLHDWFAQRLYQIACAYEDGNDANAWRTDPVFKLGLERLPLEATADLASAPTLSRLENAATRQDIYRLAVAFVDQFIASYAQPPAVIVLDLDHSEDAAHGQQELIFYHSYYGSQCYLPLFIFEGLSGKFVTAALRPGKRPTGAENAMLVKRVLKRLRTAWPDTHLIRRGDAHFANPELMQLVLADPQADFIFGLRSNAVLKPLAQPFLEATRRQQEVRRDNARRHHQPVPAVTRTRITTWTTPPRPGRNPSASSSKPRSWHWATIRASSSPPLTYPSPRACTVISTALADRMKIGSRGSSTISPPTVPPLIASWPTTCACSSPAALMYCTTP